MNYIVEVAIVGIAASVVTAGISFALTTILDGKPSKLHEAALLSEPALAEDWNRPEEDVAWAHLQPGR